MTCSDESTMGRLLVEGTEVARTLELPWRNNENKISRIPAGSYPAFIRRDGKRGWRIELHNTKPRKNIQIHIGNYQRQIKGCVLVGKTIAKDDGQCMVTESKATLAKLADTISRLAGDGKKTQEIEIRVVVR